MALFKAGLVQLPLDRYEEAAAWAKAKTGGITVRTSFYPPVQARKVFAAPSQETQHLTRDQSDFHDSASRPPAHVKCKNVLTDRLETEASSSSSASSQHGAGRLRSCASGSSRSTSSASLKVNEARPRGKGGKSRKGDSVCHSPTRGKGPAHSSPSVVSISSDGDDEVKAVFTTAVEIPEKMLSGLQLWARNDGWCDEVAEASGAQVEVDQSRRVGHARVHIVGSWRQSLAAYHLLLHNLAAEGKDDHFLNSAICATTASKKAQADNSKVLPAEKNPAAKRVWRRTAS